MKRLWSRLTWLIGHIPETLNDPLIRSARHVCSKAFVKILENVRFLKETPRYWTENFATFFIKLDVNVMKNPLSAGCNAFEEWDGNRNRKMSLFAQNSITYKSICDKCPNNQTAIQQRGGIYITKWFAIHMWNCTMSIQPDFVNPT